MLFRTLLQHCYHYLDFDNFILFLKHRHKVMNNVYFLILSYEIDYLKRYELIMFNHIMNNVKLNKIFMIYQCQVQQNEDRPLLNILLMLKLQYHLMQLFINILYFSIILISGELLRFFMVIHHIIYLNSFKVHLYWPILLLNLLCVLRIMISMLKLSFICYLLK